MDCWGNTWNNTYNRFRGRVIDASVDSAWERRLEEKEKIEKELAELAKIKEETPSPALLETLNQAKQDLEAGNASPTFSTVSEMKKWVEEQSDE